MASVLIVGAGQAGLQLAHGLLQHGYDVTLVSDRTPGDWRTGRVASSQFMFQTSLEYEDQVGISYWEEACPQVAGLGVTVPAPGGGPSPAIEWFGHLDGYGQAVDQRLKFPGLMEKFELKGGNLVIQSATAGDIDSYASEHDLVIVATGKGELGSLFETNSEQTPFGQPMRALALTYVHGLEARGPVSSVCFNLIPGVGEYFVFESLTVNGPCHIMVFEGVPEGPMDSWRDIDSPSAHLEHSLEILQTFLPWEFDRCSNVELTDSNGVLSGRFPPTVRKPIGRTSSGHSVLGLGDAVVLNDPITGQGSNNASRSANAYLASILDRGDGPFDDEWMQKAFDSAWEVVGPTTIWTNALLTPPPDHVLQLLQAANDNQRIADRFANGFDDPRDFFNWFMDPTKAEAYLTEVSG